MKPLDSFIHKHPPNRRQSKLKPFKNEIVYLYENGYQVEQIQDFLMSQKVKITTAGIYKFLENIKVKNFSFKTPKKPKNQGETANSFRKQQEQENEGEPTQEVPSFQELKNLLKKEK